MKTLTLLTIMNNAFAYDYSKDNRIFISSSGPSSLRETISSEPKVFVKHPRVYLQHLEANDELRIVANEVLEAPSIEEKIAKTYIYMQNENPYVSDPEGIDLIRKPIDTYFHGGDCEDLALLALEFFRELNLNSYFVLAPRHAFTLVGPVDEARLRNFLPRNYSYNFMGYYFDDGFYVYFDPAVRNGYPGYVDLSYLGSAVIADVNTQEIVNTIGKKLEIKNN